MKKNIKVKVYDDGDTELNYTLEQWPVSSDGLLIFHSEEALIEELLSYGRENTEIMEALSRLDDGEEDVIV